MTTSNPTQEDGTKSTNVTVQNPDTKNDLVIDRATFEKLQVVYNQALADGIDQFTFEGHVFVVGYAKYMLEYLDGRLE